jgi:hypothetical protein
MSWRPHTELPDEENNLALIAVPTRGGDATYFLPELYFYDDSDGHWYGAKNLLLMQHPVFHWLAVRPLLLTLSR